MTYRSESFDPDRHDVEHFRCGEASLDDWLREQASPAAVRRTARTWVWTDTRGAVVGFYALSAHKVSREQVPSRIGRGGPVEIPAVLIGRLALAESLRGQGLGPVLLADALSRVLEATRTVAARLVVVEALHEQAAVFYERLGFTRLPGTLRLVQKLADVEAALQP
ncbi:MAG: GNAT family N-acetyltransferase [Actinobacteria bacterium]|nr:GNAT family N-acetyltransferase [Actinomycetota bacterium]MBW3646964.1 GNAT family N-acetyltransferase [Actinomycetota bacterium]